MPDPANPARRLRFGAGEKVKRGTHGEHDTGYPHPMFDYPALLLGTSEPDEKQPRFGIMDGRDLQLAFQFTERAKWWRVPVNDFQIGMPLAHLSDEPFQHFIRRAMETDVNPVRAGV